MEIGHLWNDNDTGKQKYLEVYVSQCHFVDLKYWPGN